MSLVTRVMVCVTTLEILRIVCVSLRVWGRGWYQIRFWGVGGGGGTGENFTYGDGIRYNIIMRCNSALQLT